MSNPFDHRFVRMQTNMNAALPGIMARAGAMIVEHSLDAFRNQGWTDTALEPWDKRKSDTAKDTGRAILVKTGRLRRSIRVISATAAGVTVGTDVPYAKVHNEGFTGTVRVAGHIRMQTIKGVKGMKAKRQKQVVTKHKKYMRITKREFLGNSHQQTAKIKVMVAKQIILALSK